MIGATVGTSTSSSAWSHAPPTRPPAGREPDPAPPARPREPPRGPACGCSPRPRGDPGSPPRWTSWSPSCRPPVDPVSLRERAAEAGPYEFEIAALYESSSTLRDELALHDDHSLAAAATAALRRRPEAWGRRPVFLYGFDDLTVEQLELVRELSVGTDVTIALPWEDRES